jgi:hypothetical protein
VDIFIKTQQSKSSYPKVSLNANGSATAVWCGYGYMTHELHYEILNIINKQINSMVKKPDYFYRATNNHNEIDLINANELKCSVNHADGYAEKGLSVTDHLGYAVMCGYKYCYRLQGDVIGIGSDGEPLLDVNTIQLIDKKIKTTTNIDKTDGKKSIKELIKVLKSIGWSEDNYHDFLSRQINWIEVQG